MKKIIFLGLCLLLLFGCADTTDLPEKTLTATEATPTPTITESPSLDDDRNFFISQTGRPMLCAHRGGSVQNPENTLKAFKYAVDECQADILESDVWITKDGHLVLLHDSTVLRTSDAVTYLNRSTNLTPRDFTLEELRELNFGANFVAPDGSKPYVDIVKNITNKEQRKEIIKENEVSILTLDELFYYFYEKNQDLLFIVEIKDFGVYGKASADKINELLTKYPNYSKRLAVGTFNDDVEKYIKSAYPNIIRGASTSSANTYVSDVLLKNSVQEVYDFSCLQIPTSYVLSSGIISLISEKLINVSHEKNIAVQYWTINDEATMKLLISAKCDAIMTDDPALFKKVLIEICNI